MKQKSRSEKLSSKRGTRNKTMNIRTPNQAHSVSSLKKRKRVRTSGFAKKAKNVVRNTFNILSDKIRKPRRNSQDSTIMRRIKMKNARNRAILGIWQLLVVGSILYSSTVIFIGVDSIESRIALFPQAAHALYILVKAFSKLHK